MRLTKLTKLLRMVKFANYLEYVEVVLSFNPGLLRVFRLVFIMVLVCHWFGCTWWLITYLEREYDADALLPQSMTTTPSQLSIASSGSSLSNSTFTVPDVPPNTWHPPEWVLYADNFALKYWHAFYWGAGIALSMVPHDIEPTTTVEAVATTIMMAVGLLIAAFVISAFTSAFASMDSKRAVAGEHTARGPLLSNAQAAAFARFSSDCAYFPCGPTLFSPWST